MILLFSPFHCETRKLRHSEEAAWTCRLRHEPKNLAPDLPLDSVIKAAWDLSEAPKMASHETSGHVPSAHHICRTISECQHHEDHCAHPALTPPLPTVFKQGEA